MSLLGRFNRREFLVATLVGLLPAGLVVAEVPWLAEVQAPPRRIPRDKIRPFAPLLKTASGKVIRDRKAWDVHRRSIRAAWLKFLGPMPERPRSNRFTVLRTDRLKSVTRELIRYRCEADIEVEAYLLRPTGPVKTRRAGIVALHQTTRDTIEQIAGVKGPKMQQIGLQLAELGFVVLCPRNYLWQDAPSYLAAVARFRRRHPGALGMHKMLYDAQRAVDILAAVPDVDPRRIGAVGHSLGGKEALYLAAFDGRIAAAVASEGGVGFRFTNWEDPWYLGDGINRKDFPLNHHQLLALVAPRAFLVLAGENSSPSASDGDRTWPFFEAALPVYRLHGGPARLGLFNHRRGHSIPPVAFRRMTEWLETYLAPRDD